MMSPMRVKMAIYLCWYHISAMAAALRRGMWRTTVTVTVMSWWVARGSEREVKGS